MKEESQDKDVAYILKDIQDAIVTKSIFGEGANEETQMAKRGLAKIKAALQQKPAVLEGWKNPLEVPPPKNGVRFLLCDQANKREPFVAFCADNDADYRDDADAAWIDITGLDWHELPPYTTSDPKVLDGENYTPGEWFRVRNIEEMSAFYMSRLPAIREAAKEAGYAIGLHGSTRRDFDLIAMPWREGAADKDTLAREIQKAACGFFHEEYQWEKKPAGRYATAFPICWTEFYYKSGEPRMISGGHIDLSVIQALQSSAVEAVGVDDAMDRMEPYLQVPLVEEALVFLAENNLKIITDGTGE